MRAGVGGQLDVADGELALLVIGVDGGVGAGEAGDDDGRDDGGVACDQEEPAAADAAAERSR